MTRSSRPRLLAALAAAGLVLVGTAGLGATPAPADPDPSFGATNPL